MPLTNSSGSQYTDEQRREAVAQYVVLGNVSRVAEMTGIPYGTIDTWKRDAAWWESLYQKIQEEKSEEIDAHLTNMLHNSVEALQDRIANGDEVLTKDGESVRKLMTGRDLATVMGITFDKRQIMRNLPTSIRAESTDSRLADLASKVRELQGGTVTIDQQTEGK